MFETVWVYEVILFIYGLSLIGYFIDFIQHNQKANRIAFWLLSLVWILQTAILIDEILIEKNLPVQTVNDGLFFYAWVLITFSLIINRLFNIYFIVFFLNLFSFCILLLYFLTNAQIDTYSNDIPLVHEILITHITLTIVSYGFFTLSFIFALMYLMQYRFLKNKKGLKWIMRFADLRQLDTHSIKTVTLGVPLLLIGIILGFVWAFVANAEFYWFDLKTIGSVCVLVVYIIYLFLYVRRGQRGRVIAVYNFAAFLVLLINFFLFSILSNFHF
ncbi:MAG TPA: cytochrome c biogenesis protein CcsA [Virgibacillus sp.]|nr:cytochrome c biogenesis protein CcsA [Virgibacillus sp.]HLR67121.1 cytochrome c biogenesis protein CcsA [Virgibacillus sp.]